MPMNYMRKTALICASVTRRSLLDTKAAKRPGTWTGTAPRLQPCAPHEVLTRLGDKWTILALSLLALAPDNRLRFSELNAGIEGISQHMLTLTVRNLERRPRDPPLLS